MLFFFFICGLLVYAQVLSVNAERKRMKITLKRTLVKSKLPIITSIDQLQPDMIVHSFVLAVKVASASGFSFQNIFKLLYPCVLNCFL